ncbi:MAG: metallophosphoesterase [Candidatus Bathyarchaeia archaeon]
MKLAVIADGHLFQSFIKNYDPISDLKSVLKKIKLEDAPEALLVAGDMFDFKKTSATYLRRYEGEGLTIPLRQILEDFEIPIFSIRGNHEKEEVLRGLDQTVENFNYVKNDWKVLGDVAVYFMDSHFEGDFYEPEVVSEIIGKIPSFQENTEKTKLLLCHETFAPFENCVPKKVIEDSKKIFDWVINGHMHFWSESAYGIKNVVTLPAVLPSRVVRGKYWLEQYSWPSKEEQPKLESRDSPFGYALLDTNRETIEFRSYTPSKKIVEISIETTNLTLGEVIKRFRLVLEEIRKRSDKDSLIILPEIHGEASFVTTFIMDALKDYTDLSLEELRINTTTKILTASGKVISPPLLTPEQVYEDIEKELPEISKKLMAELQIEADTKTLERILKSIRDNELIEKMPPRTTTRLENLLEVVIAELKNVDKPKTFEDDLKSVVKRVKE